MTEYRIKPKIGKPNYWIFRPYPEDDPMGCVWPPIFMVIGYFVIYTIVKVITNTGSKLDQIICYGTLFCVVIVCILGFHDIYKDGQAAAAERQQWKDACTFSDVAIVGHYDSTSWDDGDRFRTTRPGLELEMNSDQRAVAPYNTIVSVDISEDLYNKLKKRDTVRIYYKPEAPLTFLLEEEL